MKNDQNLSVNTTQRIFNERIWIADVIVISFLTIASGYLIASLLFFELKRKVKRIPGNKEHRFMSTAKKICIATAITSLLSNLVSLCTLTVERVLSDGRTVDAAQLELACQILPRFGILGVYIGTGWVYLFLWCRQRVFYISPSLKELNNKKVKIVSYFVLGLWICYFVPASIVYCVVIRYKMLRPGGCVAVSSCLLEYRDIILSWVSVSVFMQVSLLGLFVNPIINRTRVRRQNSSKLRPTNSSSSNKLLRRVKRASVLSVMCLISDVLSASVTILTYRTDSNNLVLTYNMNLMINLLAIVAFFDNWTTLFWPWVKNKSKSDTARTGRFKTTTPQSSNRRKTSSTVTEQ